MNLVVNGQVMNSHDTDHAVEFCRRNGVTPRFYDLDLISFLESEQAHKLAVDCYCVSPQLLTHLWLLDNITGTPVMPGDFHYILGNKFFSTNTFKYFTYDFWQNNTKREFVAKMLSHSPELVISTLQLQKNNQFTWTTQYDRKCKLYSLGGFEAKPRTHKYTGFEHILKHFQTKHNSTSMYQAFNDQYRKPLQKLITQPTIQINVANDIAKWCLQ
jgi:hypothetical protein